MSQVEFKKGQKVNATNRKDETQPGVVTQVVPGKRGSFVEVQHGEKLARYRPSKVAPV